MLILFYYTHILKNTNKDTRSNVLYALGDDLCFEYNVRKWENNLIRKI